MPDLPGRWGTEFKHEAYYISKEYNGEMVLAHPIHTAIRYCANRSDINCILTSLHKLLLWYTDFQSSCIEFEYISQNDMLRYHLSHTSINYIQEKLLGYIKNNNLKVTAGSDSHSIDNYNEYINWFEENHKIINSYIPHWIS